MGMRPALKMISRLTALSLLAGSFALVHAPSTTRAESLETLLPYVIENHDRVRASKSSLTAARNRAREALGGWYPTLSQTANAGHETQENDGGADTRTGFSEYDFSLTQLLWDFGSTNAAIDKARLEVEAARFDLIETRQSLILEAITAYMNTIRSNAALGFAKESEGNIRKQTGLEEALVGLGSGFSTDVLQAKTQLAGAQARRAQSEGGLVNALNRFQAVYGRMPDNIEALNPVPYPAAFLPLSLTQATDIAMETNPSLKNAILDADIAKEDVRIARADNFTPKIEASAERKLKKNVGGTIGPKQESLAKVEMTFDFNLGFTAVNTLRASESDLSASTFTAADTRRTIEEQVRNAWQQLETAKQTASHLNNQANIAAAFLELARNERQLGRRSLIDVLSGETNLINAKSDALSAETDVLLAAYGLLAATGQLEYDVVKRSKGVTAPEIKQPSAVSPPVSTAPDAAPTQPVTPVPGSQSSIITPDVTVAEGRSASDLQAMFAAADRTNVAALPDKIETYGRVMKPSPVVDLPVTKQETTQQRYTFLHDQDTDARQEIAEEAPIDFEVASSDYQNETMRIVPNNIPSDSDTAVYSTPEEIADVPALRAETSTVLDNEAIAVSTSGDELDPISPEIVTEIASILPAKGIDSIDLNSDSGSSISLGGIVSFFQEAARANEEVSKTSNATFGSPEPVTETAALPPVENEAPDVPDHVTDIFSGIVSFFESAQPLEIDEDAPPFSANDTDTNTETATLPQPDEQVPSTIDLDTLDPVGAEIDQSEPKDAIDSDTSGNVFAFLSDVFSGVTTDVSNVSYEPMSPDTFDVYDGN